jgi:hypothetical protein
MEKQKNNPKKAPYISYRAVRDLHVLIFLVGNYWYWDRFFGFDRGFYSLPTFLDMLPVTLGWTILLIVHFWLVNRIYNLTAERDMLAEELAEHRLIEEATARLREEKQWQEFEEDESSRSKQNHR